MTYYAFCAAASALGGFFTRPVNAAVPIQAASALSPVGGYGSARVGPFRFHELVSFEAAYTQVAGVEYDEAGSKRSTLATAVVEGLNVLNMITADRVVARLSSEVPASAELSGDPAWLPLGSYFVNLRIAGVRIEPRVHQCLLNASTFAAAKAEKSLIDPDEGKVPDSLARRSDSFRRCSVFELEGGAVRGGTATRGGRISIPDFGDIYVGEYLITPGHRYLTMLRVHMHSPAGGELAVCSLQGNGSPY